jgi:hypothetical protein
MATSHLAPQLRPAERQASDAIAIVVLVLVIASIVTLMASVS